MTDVELGGAPVTVKVGALALHVEFRDVLLSLDSGRAPTRDIQHSKNQQSDGPDGKPEGEDEAPAKEKSRSDDKPDNNAKDDKDGKSGKDEDSPNDKGKKTDDPKKKRRTRLVFGILGLVVLLVAIGALIYWLLTRNLIDTDDAYTEGRAVTIAAKVAGYAMTLNVDDNTFVRTGDLILTIDPRDYITARDQARANLLMAQAQLSSAQVELAIAHVRVPANLKQAKAQLAAARTAEDNSKRQNDRQRNVDARATTQSTKDQTNATFKSDTAQVESASAQVQIAALVRQNIEDSEDTVRQREAQVEQMKAALAQAEINLSYTEIRAPQDGFITMRNVELGSFVQVGQQVVFVVAPETWVVANFKENQLKNMRPGQPVDMTVDAYPDLRLHGHVDSIQQGSGARFSAFPAQNATGNFVKIVRRVPVKVNIDSGYDRQRGLPLGLSVRPTVNVQ